MEDSGADPVGAVSPPSCQDPLFPPGLASHQPSWQQLQEQIACGERSPEQAEKGGKGWLCGKETESEGAQAGC